MEKRKWEISWVLTDRKDDLGAILTELRSGGFDDLETCELVKVRDYINEEIDRRVEKTMKEEKVL